MIKLVFIEIAYLILSLYFYHVRGDFVDFPFGKGENKLLESITNCSISSRVVFDRFKTEQQRSVNSAVMNSPGLINFQRGKTKVNKLNVIFPADSTSYKRESITKPYENHIKEISSVLGTINFDSAENDIVKEIKSPKLGHERLKIKKTEVDTKHKELIPSNATGLQTESQNFLDDLQAIKADEQTSREKITTHLRGIKRFSLNGNYSGKPKISVKSSSFVLGRRKRNSKPATSFDYLFTDIELSNISEVYKYFHSIINTLKNHINFTMRSVDINSTSDAENLCISTFEAYYRKSENDGRLYCNSSWDNFSCWPRTLAGTSAMIPCPGYLDGINEKNNATKYCNENGTWAEKAMYNLCVIEEDNVQMDSDMPHLMAIRVIYNVGFCISTLALIIALFIFIYFRSLRCLRNSIHCHLIVTFIIKNIVWIIMRHSLMYMQDSAYSWCCKTLTSIFNFAHATNFFWMFVEGLYLHVIIVWTYSADKIKLRYLLLIGWGLPSVNIIAWVIVRAVYDNDHCWFPHPEGNSVYDYVYIGPIIFVLFANIIFLSTIVWVLITKLRASHSLETRQYRKAVKATIILFPLLGITYVLFIIPPSNDPQVKIVFRYINAVLQSFQGLMVAIFYCFLNGEVKGVLKKKISRFNDARSLSTKYTRTSYGWSRGSRDFTNTVTLANGALLDPNHRVPNTCKSGHAETIPLTDTNEVKQNEFI